MRINSPFAGFPPPQPRVPRPAPDRKEILRRICQGVVGVAAVAFLTLRQEEINTGNPVQTLGLTVLVLFFFLGCAAGTGYSLKRFKQAYQNAKSTWSSAEQQVQAFEDARRDLLVQARRRSQLNQEIAEYERQIARQEKEVVRLQREVQQLPLQAEGHLYKDPYFLSQVD